jgi:ankyrin repeat protein
MPLVNACNADAVDVLQFLADQDGVDLFEVDGLGRTLAHHAALGGAPRCLLELHVRGLSLADVQQSTGMEPLFLAAQSGSLEAVMLCCEHGGTVNHITYTGCSPLFIAAKEKHMLVAKYLISEMGADMVSLSLLLLIIIIVNN